MKLDEESLVMGVPGTRPLPARCHLVLAGVLVLALAHAAGCSRPAIEQEPDSLRFAHSANVDVIEASSDGKWILTAAGDYRVVQWNAETLQMVRSFKARRFELSPNGTSMLLLAQNGIRTVPTLVSLESGEVLRRVVLPYPRAGRLHASLSRDGRYLLAIWGSANWEYSPAEMVVWDMLENRPLWEPGMPLPFPEDETPWSSELAGDSDWVQTRLGNDRMSVLFRKYVRPDGKVLALRTPLAEMSVAVDGRTMLVRHWDDTGSSTDTTTMWDIQTAEPLQRFYEPFEDPYPHLYGPDQRWFIRGKFSDNLQLCSATSGESLLQYKAHAASITSFALSPDGATVASGDDEGEVILWDRRTSRIRMRHTISDERITSLEFRRDSMQLLVGSEQRKVLAIDLPSCEIRTRFTAPGRGDDRFYVSYAPGENRITTRIQHGSYREQNSFLWDLEKQQRLCSFSLPMLERPEVSPDGQWALAWSLPESRERGRRQGWPQENLTLWHLPTLRPVHKFSYHLSSYRQSFWDQRDHELTTPGGVTIHRWSKRHYYDTGGMRVALPKSAEADLAGLDPSTREWLREFILPVSDVWPREGRGGRFAVISPDGRLGARWLRRRPSKERAIEITDIATNEPVGKVTVPVDMPTVVGFSPDAGLLVAAYRAEDNSCKLKAWDTRTLNLLWECEDVFGEPYAEGRNLFFAPSGQSFAVTTDFQRQSVVFDAASGERKIVSEGKVQFRKDGKRVILMHDEDALWNVETGEKLCVFGTHGASTDFIFSPGGDYLWHSNNTAFALYSADTGEVVSLTGRPINAFADQQSWHAGGRFGRMGTRFVTEARPEWEKKPAMPAILWDFSNGEKITDLLLPDGSSVGNATFTPDGRRLVSLYYEEREGLNGYGDPAVETMMICWDAATGKQLASGRAGTGSAGWNPGRLQFVDDGRKCLTVHPDGIMLWDLATASVTRRFRQKERGTREVFLLPDGRQMLTVAINSGATLWDLVTGVRMRDIPDIQIHGENSGSVWSGDIRVSDDGRHVMSITHHGRAIHRVDLSSGRRQWSVFFDADGDRVFRIPGQAGE